MWKQITAVQRDGCWGEGWCKVLYRFTWDISGLCLWSWYNFSLGSFTLKKCPCLNDKSYGHPVNSYSWQICLRLSSRIFHGTGQKIKEINNTLPRVLATSKWKWRIWVDWLTFVSPGVVRGVEWEFNLYAVRGEGQAGWSKPLVIWDTQVLLSNEPLNH